MSHSKPQTVANLQTKVCDWDQVFFRPPQKPGSFFGAGKFFWCREVFFGASQTGHEVLLPFSFHTNISTFRCRQWSAWNVFIQQTLEAEFFLTLVTKIKQAQNNFQITIGRNGALLQKRSVQVAFPLLLLTKLNRQRINPKIKSEKK